MEVAGKIAIYHKVVFEARYEHGLVYLDRCGATADRIISTYPDWILGEDVSPQNAPLVNLVSGIRFNFGSRKYDFSLEQPINRESMLTRRDIEAYSAQVDSVSQIVHQELGLERFTREGFRIWYLFGTDSEEDSQRWISQLPAFRIDACLGHAFGGALESEGHIAVVAASERKYRISVNPVERLERLDLGGGEVLKTLPRNLPKRQREALLAQLKAKRRLLAHPGFAVMIDVDAFLEDPIEVVPGDFIRESLEVIEASLPAALSGGKS